MENASSNNSTAAASAPEHQQSATTLSSSENNSSNMEADQQHPLLERTSSQDYGWTHWDEEVAEGVAGAATSNGADAEAAATTHRTTAAAAAAAASENATTRSNSSNLQQQPQQQARGASTSEPSSSPIQRNVSFVALEGAFPAQLHPAVSLGMRRMSSCYFSLGSEDDLVLLGADTSSNRGSVADLLSLLEDESQSSSKPLPNESFRSAVAAADLEDDKEDEDVFRKKEDSKQPAHHNYKQYTAPTVVAGSDLLYHDILMNVFTYLDAKSLAAFSETARRPNFECFYFLQLQLQRALLTGSSSSGGGTGLAVEGGTTTVVATATTSDTTRTTATDQLPAAAPNNSHHHHHDPLLSVIAGVGALSRLAALDYPKAAAIVQEFLDSNSTLKVMPLSHSLAYFRQVLQRNGVMLDHHNSSMAARAALLITVVGAASSLMSGNTDYSSAAMTASTIQSSFGTELPNMLFSVGFVGSLVGAARTMSSELQQHQQHQAEGDTTNHTTNAAAASLPPDDDIPQQESTTAARLTMRQRAERVLHKAYCAAYGYNHDNNQEVGRRSMTASSSPNRQNQHHPGTGSDSLSQHHHEPQTPNPYEHLVPPLPDDDNDDRKPAPQKQQHPKSDTQQNKRKESAPPPERKLPSGCIGAYSRAVVSATRTVTDILKQRRKQAYQALQPNEQETIARTFLDACSSDDGLATVKDLIQVRQLIDVEGFYIGADGTESCALHCAAFHGSCQVLDYLCRGLHESDASQDGGLACLDLADDNGWTALHFAAGANSVQAIRILAEHGASLSLEAVNGYTPLQWANRLHNEAAAEELRRQVRHRQDVAANHPGNNPWMSTLRHTPLSKIANGFFALIPSH